MAKILLVEDNELNRDMLGRRLRRRGYDVTIAMDGAEAIAIASAQLFDLILMEDRKSTRLNSSHPSRSRMPSSA